MDEISKKSAETGADAIPQEKTEAAGISRRDVLKMAGAGGIGLLLGSAGIGSILAGTRMGAKLAGEPPPPRATRSRSTASIKRAFSRRRKIFSASLPLN
ncbi:twin-arginine translocation signal domain-containing protein [Paenibacillus sp. P26]|nr:twin-arginine translocation signal domain-containing protein [Paenibacillus sp. P26]UUZ90463.1 twin-arginine translocation signal domain-containing protein [Paenibacillus sp. P25]